MPLIALVVILVAPAVIGRSRMRKLLMSGDVERVIGTWSGAVGRVSHPETMTPLFQATAYAAYGWIHAARRALEMAVKGPAWEAAIEQRLFIETLLDAFEGERDAAMRKATALETLPMPSAGVLVRRRVALLRRGLGRLGASLCPCQPRRGCPPAGEGGKRLASRPLGHALRRGRRCD